MQIIHLDSESVEQEAKAYFHGKYIELDNADLFLEHIEKGEIKLDGIEVPLYVSTHYVYEDRLVNNNKTRYKIPLTLVYVKDDPYEVVFDSRGKSYVAYKEEEIKFILYEDFSSFIAPFVHIVKKEKEHA